jgi:hypothetical protein
MAPEAEAFMNTTVRPGLGAATDGMAVTHR